MALVTKGLDTFYRLKYVLVFFVLLMAEGTVACGHRAMDKFIFSHGSMAS
ncbi:MAG: hypothetical protein PHZ02_00985 [Desulfocapsaceae bacterium]|nr:hypothetical protein [Desulfocapsaceae bacterium]